MIPIRGQFLLSTSSEVQQAQRNLASSKWRFKTTNISRLQFDQFQKEWMMVAATKLNKGEKIFLTKWFTRLTITDKTGKAHDFKVNKNSLLRLAGEDTKARNLLKKALDSNNQTNIYNTIIMLIEAQKTNEDQNVAGPTSSDQSFPPTGSSANSDSNTEPQRLPDPIGGLPASDLDLSLSSEEAVQDGKVILSPVSQDEPFLSDEGTQEKVSMQELVSKDTAPEPVFPVLNNNPPDTYLTFVDVLNAGGYVLNGKAISIPPAGKPVLFERHGREGDISEMLQKIEQDYCLVKVKAPLLKVLNNTTEEVIASEKATSIALNFANEHHAGGGPGFYLDPDSKKFKKDRLSARAQEESLCQRTDLMGSLTQVEHTLERDRSNMMRSMYRPKLESEHQAFISENHLYAVQGDYQNFYSSRYLEEVKRFFAITSAAEYHGGNTVNCSSKSTAYKNAEARITTHLLAAALKAAQIKKENPIEPVQLILGAFGCGVFAPANDNEYRHMIARLYKKWLPVFSGFFDFIVFAVPTFGNSNGAAYNNHKIFKEELRNFQL